MREAACCSSVVLPVSGSIPAQIRGVVTCALLPIERNRLISHHPGSFVHLSRIHAPGVQVRFGASDKEGTQLMQRVQQCKVQIAPVHYREGHSLFTPPILPPLM